MTNTHMTFQAIQNHASGCAWRVRRLAELLELDHPCDADGPVGDFEARDYGRLGRALAGIDVVLELIGQTPNAYVNREALDAMEQKVRWGMETLNEDWAKELLHNDAKSRPDDVMPF